MSETTNVVETSAAVIGKATTVTGSGMTVVAWLATWDWGFLVGVLIGLVGLIISFLNYLTNKNFQKRKDQRESEMHQLEAERKRLEIRKLSGGCNVK